MQQMIRLATSACGAIYSSHEVQPLMGTKFMASSAFLHLYTMFVPDSQEVFAEGRKVSA